MQTQPHHCPARSLVSTFPKARELGVFVVSYSSLVFDRSVGRECHRAELLRARVRACPARAKTSMGIPIAIGGENTEARDSTSPILSAPSGTTVIDLQQVQPHIHTSRRILARDLARAQQDVVPRAGVKLLRRERRRATGPLVRVEASAR